MAIPTGHTMIALADGACMDLRELLEESQSRELLRFVEWFCQKEQASLGHVGDGGNGDGGRCELLSGASQEVVEIEAILRSVRDQRGPMREAGYDMVIAGEHRLTQQMRRVPEILKEIS